MTIDREQEIGDQASQHLDHETMAASGNEMVYFEMPLPPCKKRFYVPTQFVDQGYLSSGEIKPIRSNPIGLAFDRVADKTQRGLCLIPPCLPSNTLVS